MAEQHKVVVRFNFHYHPAMAERLAREPDIELRTCDLAGPEERARADLAEAHAYQISSAKDELPRQWFASAELLERCPRLLCVSAIGAGYDTVDVAACTRAGVLVVNQSGANAPAVAEHTLGLMLDLAKRITESDRRLRRDRGYSREDLMGREIGGKTLGLVGIGHIGGRVAKLARAFGMTVLASDPVGVNLVEFVGHSEEEVEVPLGRITGALAAEGGAMGRRGFTVARGHEDVERIWAMRKKAVGLLGNMKGDKRPIPFVEDTAVPPENLADYIAEFRGALDRRGLVYGMFGHVDAGVLHVRPAIDLKDPAQERLIREVTEEVVALTRKHGGLLWGEHGKGVRSEFSPGFFGPLYPTLQAIKAAFDPDNRLNPGKIAAPGEGGLLTVDGVPMKGQADRTIPPEVRAAFDEALHCNGNGACYNWDPDDPMCPSWKGMRERRHSPKGRAQLIREWLRQLAALGFDPVEESRRLRRAAGWRSLPARLRNTWARRRGEPDFSHEVKEALDGCLACKSCTGQCPIKVDVPTFRSKFFELYYGRYLRPSRDYVVGSIEHLVPLMARVPGLANALAGRGPGRAALRAVGLVGTPALSGLDIGRELGSAASRPRRRTRCARSTKPNAPAASWSCRTPSPAITRRRSCSTCWTWPGRSVSGPGSRRTARMARRCMCTGSCAPSSAPPRPTRRCCRRLAATGVELVGLDPSMTLAYRSEYGGALDKSRLPRCCSCRNGSPGIAMRCRRSGAAPRTSSCRIARNAPRRSPPCATGAPFSPRSACG